MQYRPLMTLSAVIAVSAFIGLLFVFKTPTEAMRSFGFVLVLINVFWLYFDKLGWSHRIFRPWLTSVPDLRGRWEGAIDRRGDDPPHPFVMEIRQTFSSVKCYTFTERGDSASIVTGLVPDETRKSFTFVFSWIARTGPMLSGAAKGVRAGMFYGTTIFSFISPKSRRLQGEYFTNREPEQTRGTLALEWKTAKLEGKFESHDPPR